LLLIGLKLLKEQIWSPADLIADASQSVKSMSRDMKDKTHPALTLDLLRQVTSDRAKTYRSIRLQKMQQQQQQQHQHQLQQLRQTSRQTTT
jgi:hypothetical protein